MITMIALGPVESNSNGYSIRIGHLMDSLLRHDEVTLIEFNIAEPRGGGETRYHRVEYDAVYREHRIGDLLNRTITFNPLGQLKMQLVCLRGLWRNRDLIKKSDVVFIEGALFPLLSSYASFWERRSSWTPTASTSSWPWTSRDIIGPPIFSAELPGAPWSISHIVCVM